VTTDPPVIILAKMIFSSCYEELPSNGDGCGFQDAPVSICPGVTRRKTVSIGCDNMPFNPAKVHFNTTLWTLHPVTVKLHRLKGLSRRTRFAIDSLAGSRGAKTSLRAPV
jgi:hypothetical protein